MSHTRSKSAPSARPLRDSDSDTLSEADNVRTNGNNREEDENGDAVDNNSGSQETIRYNNLHHGSSDSVVNEPFYDLPEGEDYMAIYETIDRKRQEVRKMALIHYLVHYLSTTYYTIDKPDAKSQSKAPNSPKKGKEEFGLWASH